MTQFRKKPVVIEAIQWIGSNLREVIAFTDGPPDTRTMHAQMAWDDYSDLVDRDGLKIHTLEGKMLANVGDWIIKGVKGEFYPCKPDIFVATYEAAPAAPGPFVFGDEEHVAVPRGLIGAACSAIEHKREGKNTLAELRRYTFGDKSAAIPPSAPVTLPAIDPGPDSLEREIQAKASVAPHVTPADIEAEIASEHYFTAAHGVDGAMAKLDQRHFDGSPIPANLNHINICVLILRNGTKLVGVNEGPVSPENFDPEIGRRYAREKALDQLWPLLGFRLRDQLAASKSQ